MIAEAEIETGQLEISLDVSVKRVSPDMYRVIQPNVLISTSNKSFKIAEHRLYTEILAIDHKIEPDRLTYSFPYSIVRPHEKNATSHAWRDAKNIMRQVQGRVFELPEEMVKKIYGDEMKAATFSPLPTVLYSHGQFHVELHRDFKRVLSITRDNFTKGDREMLQGFKHPWSHKVYWLIREKQPWKSKLEFKVQELKDELGVGDKYKNRYDNFKENVLKPAMEELKNTWAEFTVTEERGGRGGKELQKIILLFRSDMKQELRAQKDLRFKYEVELAQCELPISSIHSIRRKIYFEELILEDSTVVWDHFYVEQTIEIAKTKKAVRNMKDYVFKALVDGTFIPEIEKRRKILNPAGQYDIFGEKVQDGNKMRAKRYDEFVAECQELFGDVLSVEEVLEKGRYQVIIDKDEGKIVVKV